MPSDAVLRELEQTPMKVSVGKITINKKNIVKEEEDDFEYLLRESFERRQEP